MKHLINLLFLSFLLLYSCSGEQFSELELENGQQKPQTETKSICFGFDEITLSSFAANGITELGIYVYLEDLLVYGKNLPLNNGILQIEVPLGENLKTFAVANAGEITDAENLSTIIVYQDINSQKEIYMSDITSFISDRTVKEVNLELKRMVGQAVFQPKETVAELSSITSFDALDVIFNNVVTGYMPGANKYILGNATVNTKISDNYRASIYSFSTIGDNLGSIEVVYLKGKTEVNRTKRPLDVTIEYTISKRVVVNMPILNNDYLEKSLPATRMMKPSTSSEISIQEYQF